MAVSLNPELLYQQESYGDSKETNMFVYDRGSGSQIRFRVSAEVDEDKLTTRILMSFDEQTEVSVVEGEDPCIDFFYKSFRSEPIYDLERGCQYQLFWSKGNDSDLTYDQIDQGLKAGSYQLSIGNKMFHELKVMDPEDEPVIMRQNMVSQWTGDKKTSFFPLYIKG